jgi:hypothetical protein
MLRYNQGFKRLGPMEQCSDGEWVRWDDVKSHIQVRDQSWQQIIDSYREQQESVLSSAETLRECCDAYKTIVDKQYIVIRHYMILCGSAISMFAILMLDLVSKAL